MYVKIRNADNVGFHDIWHTVVDPADKSIDKTPLAAGDVTVLLNSGPSEEKIDLSIIGDGYRMSEHTKFIGDARRAMQYLFSTAPYSEHQRAFNVRAVFVASGTSFNVLHQFVPGDPKRPTQLPTHECTFGT